jgi:putative redox protein
MRFDATSGDHAVTIDYPLPADACVAGMTPLQLLLASLAACSGSTLALLLKRMGQTVDGLEVTARGTRRDQHPTVLTQISLEFEVRGSGIAPEMVEHALRVAEDQLCPVWAMLKGGTPITTSWNVTPGA